MRSSKSPTTVPDSILTNWKRMQSRGDVQVLTHLTGYSKPTIIKALKHGVASADLILAISRYFSKKLTASLDMERRALKLLNQAS